MGLLKEMKLHILGLKICQEIKLSYHQTCYHRITGTAVDKINCRGKKKKAKLCENIETI